MTRRYNPKSKENLKPFKRDNPETGEKDPRINRKGRISSFDQLRQYLQSFLDENVSEKDKRKKLRKLIEEMANDKRSHKDLLEFSFGKVPLSQIVDITSGGKALNWKMFINGDSDTEDK